MHVTIVSAVPFDCTGAFLATNVENSGESAITAIPQNIRNSISNILEEIKKIMGEKTQHTPEQRSAVAATFFAPYFSER